MSDIKVNVPDNYFDSVMISAVRYCIGRRTYIPEMVTSWIMGHCGGLLGRGTIHVMQRDIDEANSLGDRCDVETWTKFRAWLNKQEGITDG